MYFSRNLSGKTNGRAKMQISTKVITGTADTLTEDSSKRINPSRFKDPIATLTGRLNAAARQYGNCSNGY